jgi:hypothetical protein
MWPAADFRGDDLQETGLQNGGLAHVRGVLLEADAVSYLDSLSPGTGERAGERGDGINLSGTFAGLVR